MKSRLRLILAATAFVGWIAVLSYAALTKSRAPIVSHIQPAVADAAIVAELGDTAGARALVVEKLWGAAAPAAGTTIVVVNLPDAKGFTESGKYLLYLANLRGGWSLVVGQRSPGNEGGGPPLIYAWSEDVRKQAEHLRPAAK